MKASEVIDKLQQLIREHGDLPVIVHKIDERDSYYAVSDEVDYRKKGFLDDFPKDVDDGFLII